MLELVLRSNPLSPDGKLLALTDRMNAILLVDTRTGSLVRTFVLPRYSGIFKHVFTEWQATSIKGTQYGQHLGFSNKLNSTNLL